MVQTVEYIGNVVQYNGVAGVSDNDVLVTTGDVSRYNSFMLISTAGAMDVFVSVDGTNYATAALSLQDMGATTTNPVLVTVANRAYGFRGLFRKIKVLQNGVTGVTAPTLLCGNA